MQYCNILHLRKINILNLHAAYLSIYLSILLLCFLLILLLFCVYRSLLINYFRTFLLQYLTSIPILTLIVFLIFYCTKKQTMLVACVISETCCIPNIFSTMIFIFKEDFFIYSLFITHLLILQLDLHLSLFQAFIIYSFLMYLLFQYYSFYLLQIEFLIFIYYFIVKKSMIFHTPLNNLMFLRIAMS